MDEVRTERLLEEYEESTLKVLICDWPNSKGYAGKPELVSSLEHQVNICKSHSNTGNNIQN